MKKYCINYIMYESDQEHTIYVTAENKEAAYDIGVYEQIMLKEKSLPYSAWVTSVTYNNGKSHRFNSYSGKRY